MAAVTERATVGAETARMEGKGVVGRATEAAMNVATGRDGPHYPLDRAGETGTGVGYDGLGDRSGFIDTHHHNGEGIMGRTEEEMARLRNRTEITREGEPYAPNPNMRDLPKEFETRVQVVQRYPEMKTVEKTDFVKEVHHEERLVTVPKTRVIMEEVERVDRVPMVKEATQTRMETVHRVVTEEREVSERVPVVEYVEVPRMEQVPRVITEDVEETVRVPVVTEVPVTRMVEVPTGNYCESTADDYITPGNLKGLDGHGLHHQGYHGVGSAGVVGAGAGGLLHRSNTSSSSSSSSSDDEDIDDVNRTGVGHINPDGTTFVNPAPKKKSLFKKLLHH